MAVVYLPLIGFWECAAGLTFILRLDWIIIGLKHKGIYARKGVAHSQHDDLSLLHQLRNVSNHFRTTWLKKFTR